MIRNLRTGAVISREELHCRNPLSLALGLRFRRAQIAVLCLPKPRRVSLDMWFVFYSIDVLFLDERRKVVEIKRNLRPWRGYNPSTSWAYAVEIPSYRGVKNRHSKLDRFTFKRFLSMIRISWFIEPISAEFCHYKARLGDKLQF
ncbi:MAG TPA: DUF192 domain-containing protein [Candidatus Nanoarchaeia archaeon]|nr:DUF192 domain-containing protein [Candidatus Nanoarchaeia archaeon]